MTEITYLGNGVKTRVHKLEFRVNPEGKLWLWLELDNGKLIETPVLTSIGVE